MSDSDRDFEQRVRSALDSGVTGLDGATRRQLAEMRARALDHKPLWSHWLSVENWIPVTAFASITVVTAILLLAPADRDPPTQLALQENDIALEVLFGEDEHEDLSDPDFYVWLDLTLLEEEEPNNAG